MQNKRHVRSFRDLLVYNKANEVSKIIFEISKQFPREEIYSLTDQIRRASRSIGAHIAEAWGKRRYEKHFVSKLTDADAEQLETQHWLGIALSCGYLETGQEENLKIMLQEIGRMLNGMMSKSHFFCGQDIFLIREEPDNFHITD